MRVLVICDVLFPQTTGGAGRLARELATALRELDCEVEFLTRPTSTLPQDDPIKTTYFPKLSRGVMGGHKRAVQRVVEEYQPDILHVHQPLPAFLSLPADSIRPTVYTFHSSWPEEFRIKSSPLPSTLRALLAPLLATVEKSVVNRSEVVVLSEFSRREVGRLYGREATIIPGGVNTKHFFPPRGEERRDGKVRLATLRNLVPRMGLSQLVRAVERLPDSFSLEIGGQGPLRSDLEQLIEALGLGQRVRLVGHVPDDSLRTFYSTADWFVLPTSQLEGFGLVILESLACGTPVLGTRIGAIPETLSKFDPAWIIDEPQPEDIADTILAATRKTAPSPLELHQRVASVFDWKQIAKQYLELFQRLSPG